MARLAQRPAAGQDVISRIVQQRQLQRTILPVGGAVDGHDAVGPGEGTNGQPGGVVMDEPAHFRLGPFRQVEIVRPVLGLGTVDHRLQFRVDGGEGLVEGDDGHKGQPHRQQGGRKGGRQAAIFQQLGQPAKGDDGQRQRGDAQPPPGKLQGLHHRADGGTLQPGPGAKIGGQPAADGGDAQRGEAQPAQRTGAAVQQAERRKQHRARPQPRPQRLLRVVGQQLCHRQCIAGQIDPAVRQAAMPGRQEGKEKPEIEQHTAAGGLAPDQQPGGAEGAPPEDQSDAQRDQGGHQQAEHVGLQKAAERQHQRHPGG